MSGLNINSILPSPQLSDAFTQEGTSPESSSFGNVLKDVVAGVNQANEDAASGIQGLIQGKNADLTNVMIAVEKADVSFQLMMQVRNKIVAAYQDIEKMQF